MQKVKTFSSLGTLGPLGGDVFLRDTSELLVAEDLGGRPTNF